MTTQLNPCPHCNGRARYYSYYAGGFYYGVECAKCNDVYIEGFRTKEQAAEAWNKDHD